MNQLSQYKILTSEGVIETERLVNEAISNGWIPQGGLAVTYDKSSKAYTFSQAVVKVKVAVEK